MAIRIPWDDREAAYLLYGLVRVLNKEIPRAEAIQLVSDTLRKRAMLRGVEIDDVFRNINGITLQMSIMEYIYTNGKHGLKKSSMPKLFQRIVDLYKCEKTSFEMLIKETTAMLNDKSNEEQFCIWLATQVSPNMLSDFYAAYRDISSFCLERKILKSPLLETVDLRILNDVRLTVESNKVFRFTYKRQLSKMSMALRQYISFVKDYPACVNSPTVDATKNVVSAKVAKRSLDCTGTTDKLIQLIKNHKLAYIDLRDKGGCLWVYDGADIPSFVEKCRRHGVVFQYKEDGGNVTSGKPAWWTKDIYQEFASTVAPNSSAADDNKQTDGKAVTLDFENRDRLPFTKPISFSYFGEEHSLLESWKQLYVEVIQCLYEDYPDKLSSYINKNIAGQGRSDFADDAHQRLMTSPKQVSDGLYLETNLSAADITAKIKHILDICCVDYENLEIRYIVKSARPSQPQVSQPCDTSSNTAAISRSSVNENRQRFIEWMRKNGSATGTVMSYLSDIGQCTKCYQQFAVANSDLYDVTSAAELIQIRDKLLAIPSFKQLNNQQHNRFLSAMNKLIAYRQSFATDTIVTERPNIVEASSPKVMSFVPSELKERYEHILSTYFGEDGYQPGRAIFRGRFKRFYTSEYGMEPSETDDRIDGLLQMVGTMRDGRVFPKQDSEQNNLMREIIQDILEAFEEGASGIYIEAVFNKYQFKLADNLQIYTVDALTPMLLTNGTGKFTQKYSYLVKDRGNADSASDILRIMKAFHQPQNYEAIHQKAWFIPYDRMKSLLVWDKSIVNVAPETYFYAPNLPVSSAELQQLISIIHKELEYRSYITDVDLMDLIRAKCPSVAINTDGFTTYGLRNCLGYILRDHFSFNGPIISQLGKELSMSDVYAEFARNHEELSFDDLKRLSSEMNIGIYWDSVLEEMVRVSDQIMIRRDLIDFDVDLIDSVLEGMCPAQYVSIKDVNLFLQFPNIGYAWNHYVLESYLFKNSRKFKLLHVSFGQNSVCGAMVKTDSAISDYRTLIVDVLSKSNALGSTKAALQYIVDHGYQQRRRYDGIEQLIQEAKIIKEQRENEEK